MSPRNSAFISVTFMIMSQSGILKRFILSFCHFEKKKEKDEYLMEKQLWSCAGSWTTVIENISPNF